jgi:hypothetical protein
MKDCWSTVGSLALVTCGEKVNYMPTGTLEEINEK